jgi:hypothetical protein
MEWRTIDSAPEEGFFLVYEDGAVRTKMRFDGKWSNPDIPLLVLPLGDRMVSREVEVAYPGMSLAMSECCTAPTHWMPLPPPPATAA